MLLLNDALRALAHNFSTLLLALVLIFGVSAGFFFANALAASIAFPPKSPAPEVQAELHSAPAPEASAKQADEPEIPARPTWLVLFTIVWEVGFAVAVSIVYAVVFAMLGRALDRPFWKCEVPGEAVRRFFVPWFILTLASLALRDLQMSLGSLDAMLMLEFVLLLLGLFTVPIGACVMHRGALVWEELGDVLGVIPRQLRMFLPIVLIGLLQYILQTAAGEVFPQEPGAYFERAAYATVLNLPMFVVDLLVFCMVWRICMLDRDAGPVEDDAYED